jgi:fructan beta-fructosidase
MDHPRRLLTLCVAFLTVSVSHAQSPYHEPFRPQVHFSPLEKWTNDPNGMVYYQGVYHLFFQYYPNDIVWGPMHWGHATSTDLVHWRQLPVALYPDTLGYIFSGCVVVDSTNTSGFGKDGKGPLVAIFTQHDPKGEQSGSKIFQNQSLAYSVDSGKTWIKFKGNPVLHNPGIADFRDPSVMWYAPARKWIMSLAIKDRIGFYSSLDLRHWMKEGEFGENTGAHGGVWECPNLFPLSLDGATWWVLLVSTNPGGPNGGSGTQYFVGQFDGHGFHTSSRQVKWIDYGPDDYAGVTWNNTGHRRIFLGWMSNWDYANKVPTSRWRNAMTLPRELSLQQAGKEIYVVSRLSREVDRLSTMTISLHDVQVPGLLDLTYRYRFEAGENPYRLVLQSADTKDFSVTFLNGKGQKLVVGYEKATNEYYIDRTSAGASDFQAGFARRCIAPRTSSSKPPSLTILVDAASVEVLADGGLTVMTAIFFPEKPLSRIQVAAPSGLVFQHIYWSQLRSIW